MTKKEMAERSRKALQALNRLPLEEQVKRLVALGTIDERGNVQMGEENGREEKERDSGVKR